MSLCSTTLIGSSGLERSYNSSKATSSLPASSLALKVNSIWTSILLSVAVNVKSFSTGFPSISSCAFSDFIICQPLSWYCVPVSRPSKVTVSTIVTSLLALMVFSPVALSLAVVCIVMIRSVIVTVCPSSSMSLCSAILIGSSGFVTSYNSSKVTSSLPASSLALKVNSIWTSILLSVAVNVRSFSTGFPSTSNCVFSAFIICQPLSWYFVPFFRPSKVTVSTIVTFLPATIDFSPVALSAAVVWIVISGSYSSVSVPKSITVLFLETTTSKAGISVIPLLESQRNSSIV